MSRKGTVREPKAKVLLELTPEQQAKLFELDKVLSKLTARGEFCGVLAQVHPGRRYIQAIILDAETTSEIIEVMKRQAYLSEEQFQEELAALKSTQAVLQKQVRRTGDKKVKKGAYHEMD